MHPWADRSGFTLVELVVVVTIIVVLLALMMPTLDQAVYQAELAQCAANLKATGGAVTLYAMENGRRYPDRDLPEMVAGSTAKQADPYLTPKLLARPLYEFDMRPAVRPLLKINTSLRCPLTPAVELDTTAQVIAVDTSYTMWWGWRYYGSDRPLSGMYRLGDRWAWQEAGALREYALLAGDYDAYFPGEGVQSSHPDRLDLLQPVAVENAPGLGELWNGTQYRTSIENTAAVRGEMDMNHVYADLSVSRYVNVVGQHVPAASRDERMDRVPLQTFNQQALKKFQVPRQ